MRGQLTLEVQQKAIEVLGREISVEELHLMPYVQYVMMNEQRIDPHRINAEEREILSDWRLEGWIDGGGERPCGQQTVLGRHERNSLAVLR